jgi:hypothetical protein
MAADITPNEEGMRQHRRFRCALGHLSVPVRFVADFISSAEWICVVIFWPAWWRFYGGNIELMLSTSAFSLLLSHYSFTEKFYLGALFKAHG